MATTSGYIRRAANGEWQLSASRVPLATVIRLWRSGKNPEAIANELAQVNVADVYGAIAAYLHDQEAIDSDLSKTSSAAERATPVALSDFQRHGLSELLQAVYDALTEGSGKPSAAHLERINQMIAHYHLPYVSYRETINTAFGHWYRANPHKRRLGELPPAFVEPQGRPGPGEEKEMLSPEARRALSAGLPSVRASDAYCRQLGLAPTQARRIVGGMTVAWRQRQG